MGVLHVIAGVTLAMAIAAVWVPRALCGAAQRARKGGGR